MLYCNHSKGKEQRNQDEGCTVRLNAKYIINNNLGCDLRKKGEFKMTTLKINFRNHTIEMPSMKYATAASKFGTIEYQEVQQACKDFPTYNITIRTAQRRPNASRGLTLEVMEDYISKNDKNGEVKKQYDFLRGKDNGSVPPAPYFKIKKWFLETYPNYSKSSTTNEQ